MLYIAYGSNMVKSQMAQRCRDARFVGAGYLEHARLEFHHYATFIPTHDNTSRIPVAVWDVSERDLRALDVYESYPEYYGRARGIVTMRDGSQIEGIIYYMRIGWDTPPIEGYYKPIIQAYRELGFDSEIETILMPTIQRAKER